MEDITFWLSMAEVYAFAVVGCSLAAIVFDLWNSRRDDMGKR